LSRRAESRRRIWPRPSRALRATRAGWCFIAIIFGVGFAALNTGNNLLYLVLALMLAFLVLSGLLSEASLRGLGIERRLPRELFARAPNRIVLRVQNPQRRVAAFAISVEDRFLGSDGPEPAGRIFALRIPPQTTLERSYLFEPPRRGELTWLGVRVSTRFPFGLFVKSTEIDCPTDGLVYPRIERPGTLPPWTEGGQEAGATPVLSHAGEQIVGLRELAEGDAPGRIHWPRSLRAQQWLVGEREADTASEIEVRLPLRPGEPESWIEDRISRAAGEIVRHFESGLRVGLRTPDQRFAPEAGRRHRRALLSHLARLDLSRIPPRPTSLPSTQPQPPIEPVPTEVRTASTDDARAGARG
jgi:uncharacterized protein (DUF58 family)